MTLKVTTSFKHYWLLLLILQFCGSAHASETGINLQQADGGSIHLTAPARRIVTLAPNLAELVFAAGAGDRLKGVVRYSHFPDEVKNIPRVGDAFRIDLERILDIEPDLVIAWRSGNPQTALQKLQQLGLKVWQIEIGHPHEIAATVEAIALAAGTLKTGQDMAAQLRTKLAGLEQANAHKRKVDFFYQVAAQPLYTVNGQHIISRGLTACGGHNVFSDLPGLAPQISREAVIAANPESLIAPHYNDQAPGLDTWLDWPQLRAVEHGSLLYLPADQISQATPRLLDAIELACKLLDQVRQKTPSMEG